MTQLDPKLDQTNVEILVVDGLAFQLGAELGTYPFQIHWLQVFAGTLKIWRIAF